MSKEQLSENYAGFEATQKYLKNSKEWELERDDIKQYYLAGWEAKEASLEEVRAWVMIPIEERKPQTHRDVWVLHNSGRKSISCIDGSGNWDEENIDTENKERITHWLEEAILYKK